MKTAALPSRVAILVESWKTFVAISEEYSARVGDMREKTMTALAMKDSLASYHDFSSRCLPDIAEAAKSLLGALAYEAKQTLSPAGSSLEINHSELESKFRYHEDCAEFDPLKVWEYLVETYSPAAAYQQQAVSLRRNVVELYRRNEGQAVKRVSGRPVITVSVYTESYSSSFYGYNAEESLKKALTGLATVLSWSGLVSAPDVSVAKEKVIERVVRCGKEQPIRECFTDEILVVPYKSKVEFRISERLFEQLSIFIAEYGPAPESY